jgi:ATP-dependent 26S proteasome regulatory subunit
MSLEKITTCNTKYLVEGGVVCEAIDEKEMLITSKNTDSVVFSVIESFKSRADAGLKKYGVNLDRKDLSVLDWIQHAQEEHMDAILYLEKLKQQLTEQKQLEK